jgi:hypothetical protein
VPEIIYPSSKSPTLEEPSASYWICQVSFILIILFGYGQSSLGSSFPDIGPGIAVESYNPTGEDNNYESAGGDSQKISVLRYHAWILAPIPVAVFSGLLTFQGALISESQKITTLKNNDFNLNLKPSIGTRRVTNVGLKWHPHHKEGAPKFYVQLERTGLPDRTQTIRPVSSFTVGSEIGEDDLPNALTFQATDLSETKVYVTTHRFPTYYKFDVGVGHKLKIKQGLLFDLLIPEHFFLGYQTDDDVFSFAFGTSKQREFLPWFRNSQRGWSEEWNEKKLIMFNWKIFEPVHIAFDLGHQRKIQKLYDYEQNVIEETSTSYSPFMRIAFETWLSVI